MLFHQYVTMAVNHELTKSAIQVAVREVRGRVAARRTVHDDRFEERFRAFAEKICAVTIAPVRDDLSCVGAQEDWRKTFSAETWARLEAGFGTSLAQCYPSLAATKQNMSLEAFVRYSARQIWREMYDVAPAVGFVYDALCRIVNVAAQVARCVSGDLDPLILLNPAVFTPIDRVPVIRERPLQQPQNLN